MKRFDFFSALVAGFSVFSLCVRIWDIGLAPVMDEFLRYFRALLQWLFAWTRLLGFSVPGWYLDLFALSSIGVGIFVRGRNWAEVDEEQDMTKQSWHVFLGTCLLMSTSLAGLVLWLGHILSVVIWDDKVDPKIRGEIFRTLGALVFLFAANAYGLSAVQ